MGFGCRPRALSLHFFDLTTEVWLTPASAIAKCFGLLQSASRLPVTPTCRDVICAHTTETEVQHARAVHIRTFTDQPQMHIAQTRFSGSFVSLVGAPSPTSCASRSRSVPACCCPLTAPYQPPIEARTAEGGEGGGGGREGGEEGERMSVVAHLAGASAAALEALPGPSLIGGLDNLQGKPQWWRKCGLQQAARLGWRKFECGRLGSQSHLRNCEAVLVGAVKVENVREAAGAPDQRAARAAQRHAARATTTIPVDSRSTTAIALGCAFMLQFELRWLCITCVAGSVNEPESPTPRGDALGAYMAGFAPPLSIHLRRIGCV
eukprot:SAG11_NODE_1393_length_5047_cov_14.071140_5_plen_321_part_00